MLHKFYPVVPDSAWVARLAALGVKTIQLRMKEMPPYAVAAGIANSLEACAKHDCQLIVNDYWREAIECDADFVHLGQGDLAEADLAAIRKAGLKLGLSTHNHEELANALAARPSYVALGPIYETKLKAMPWAPQGLARIAEWKSRIGALPLVAIGGITLERAASVYEAGADSVAVVTDIIAAADPEARTEAWLALTSSL
jgi:thiamine-phosphate pyrophosphorylase